jgi:hypothetical protein
MAFSLTVENCGGETHAVRINADGSVSVDPDTHDVELERSLVELGAKEPKCLSYVGRYAQNPFHIVGDVKYMLRDDPTVCFYETGINSLLACDFIEHVFRIVPDHSSERAKLLQEGLGQARTYYSLPDILMPYVERPQDSEYLYKASVARGTLVRTGDIMAVKVDQPEPTRVNSEQDIRNKDSILRLCLAFITVAHGAHSNSFKSAKLQEVARTCVRACSRQVLPESFKTTPRAHLIAEGAESDWQIARTVAVLTAIIEGKPWPSIT